MSERDRDGAASKGMSSDEAQGASRAFDEDDADAAVFAERLADLAAGADERLSPEATKAVLNRGK